MASLNDGDLQALGARWIPPELAEAAGIYRVESADGAAIIGRKGSGDYAGLAIPYTWPGAGTRARSHQLRSGQEVGGASGAAVVADGDAREDAGEGQGRRRVLLR